MFPPAGAVCHRLILARPGPNGGGALSKIAFRQAERENMRVPASTRNEQPHKEAAEEGHAGPVLGASRVGRKRTSG